MIEPQTTQFDAGRLLARWQETTPAGQEVVINSFIAIAFQMNGEPKMKRKIPLIHWQSLACALVGVAVLVIASPVQALRIENLTTNEVIFSDNFESVSVGSNPVADVGIWDLTTGQNTILVSDGISADVTGDYDGNGSAGDEDFTEWKAQFGQSMTPGDGADGNGNGTVDAADYTVWRDNLGSSGGGGVAAYEGDHFLHLSRPVVGAEAPDVRPSAYVLPFQTTPGDKFRISFAAYVPSQSGSFVWQFGGGDRFNWLYMDAGTGDIFLSFVPVPALKAAFQRDKWQEWSIEFELGSAESDWTLDGVTHHQTTALNSDPDFKSWLIDLSTNTNIYLDSIPTVGLGQSIGPTQVPEPNSLLLFAGAAIAIASLRRHICLGRR